MNEVGDEELERQPVETIRLSQEEALRCGGSSPLDFRIFDEYGTVLEVERAQDRLLVNICQKESRSSMFLTKDLGKIRALRDALTRILDAGDKSQSSP